VLRGGLGDDTIYASSSGLNRVAVDGGLGNDFISNAGWSNSAWTIAGGEGNDRIEMGGNFHVIDAGAGNDTIDFEVAVGKTGSGTVTTGAGSDTIELSLRAVVDDQRSAVVVTDFTTGAGGDKLDLVSVIDRLGLPAGTDPFAGGYLHLVASGANTYVEGTLTPGVGAQYTTMAVLQGVAPGSLTADNFVQTVSPVVSANQGPVVELPHAVTLQGSGATPLGITVPTDPEGGALTITLSAVPDKDYEGIIQLSSGTQVYAGNTLSEAQLAGLTFTPVAGATGVGATLFYTVIDDAGNKVRTSILLDTPNTAPTVNVADQVYAVDGITPFSYDLKTVVSDALSVDNVLNYAISVNGGALPAWLSFDPFTHVFTGTAPVATDTAYTIALTVTDPQGLVTTTSFMLTPPGVALTGTAGNDTLTGHAGPDTLAGLAGNDLLDGGAGKDTMSGGLGNDTYLVDNAGDVIVENLGEGTDAVISSVNYILGANLENLTLTGSATSATGNELNNTLTGTSGNNTLNGGAGADTLIGGAGNDTYVVDSVGDVVTENAGEGTDTVQSSISYTLGTDVENLTLTGVTAINGTGNAADNVLIGNAADNVLNGQAGNDTMTGGAGNDTYVVDAAGDVVTENVGEGTDTVQASISYTLGANVESLVLTGTTAINATGNTQDNTLTGNSGSNTLDGGAGSDSLAGGLGNDTYVVDNVGDVIVENAGEGTDTVQSSVTHTLSANVENLTLTGLAAINGTGNELDNLLTGNAANNVLTGLAGNDTLDGGAGIDTMIGGLGNDTYVVDNAGDVVTENAGEGTDTIQTSLTTSLVSLVNVENLTLTGTAAINGTGNDANNVLTGNDGNNSLLGGLGNDSLVGGAGVDTLDGGVGNDTMAGGLGNDVYYVDSALDVLVENVGEGTDTVVTSTSYSLKANFENLALSGSGAANVNGNELNNTVAGNNGDNSIFGLAGNDKLTGNGGNDTLDGGVGTDTLIGGLGNDKYYVDALTDVVTENLNEGTDTVVSYLDYTLGANLENLILSGTALVATGNELNNVLTGNALANTLNGGLGNDTLDGGSGIDTMTGGLGNDTYVVDNVGDVVIENAGEGTDTIQTGMTFSLVSQVNIENLTLTGTLALNGTGNDANNVLTGNDGNNLLLGGLGNDSLVGGAGVDTLDGGVGNDTMAGGLGNDVYYVDSALDVLVENVGEGTDTVVTSTSYSLRANFENLALSGSGAANVNGNELDNTVAGNNGDNSILGLAGNDKLTGNGGNDTLDGGAGTDTLIGGLGNDKYYVDSLIDVVTENLNEGTDTVVSYIDYTLGANLENLILSGTALVATGNELNNVLTGNALANTLNGGLGNDTLDGGSGIDTMTGGLGNDTYVVDNISDVVIENVGEGTDTIQTAMTYSLVSQVNIENLTLTGLLAANATGNDSNNVLIGNDGNNLLLGGLGNDSLVGGAGVDTLDGGVGNDTMAGGLGNDVYYVDSSLDVLVENVGEGTDTVVTSTSYSLRANFENLSLSGSSAANVNGNELDNTVAGNNGDNSILGLAGNDKLTGNGGNDTLDGGAGTDTLIGGLGNDKYYVDSLTDVITENLNEGTDTVVSYIDYTLGINLENLTLSGTALAANGNELNNVLLGNALANTLSGGLGNDTLTGGAGADQFVFNTALNASTNVDHVTDFSVGSDQVVLSSQIFAALGLAGTMDPTLFHAGAGMTGSASAAQGAGLYYDTTAGTLYYDPDGFGGVAATKFAVFDGIAPALKSTDFIIGA
jgi:Ca2+-binding RTX toxin-like protein